MPTSEDPQQPAPQPEAGESPTAPWAASTPPAASAPPAASTPPAVPPPLLPTAAAPPIAPPSMASADGSPIPPPIEPPKKKGRFGLVGAFIAVAAAAIGAIFVKFILPLVLVGAVGQVFDSAFGGPYNRLPSDIRSGFDKRLEAAVGNTLDGQSDAAKGDRILTLVKSGLSRLDDGLINTNFQLTTKAIGAVDVPSCADRKSVV